MIEERPMADETVVYELVQFAAREAARNRIERCLKKRR